MHEVPSSSAIVTLHHTFYHCHEGERGEAHQAATDICCTIAFLLHRTTATSGDYTAAIVYRCRSHHSGMLVVASSKYHQGLRYVTTTAVADADDDKKCYRDLILRSSAANSANCSLWSLPYSNLD